MTKQISKIDITSDLWQVVLKGNGEISHYRQILFLCLIDGVPFALVNTSNTGEKEYFELATINIIHSRDRK